MTPCACDHYPHRQSHLTSLLEITYNASKDTDQDNVEMRVIIHCACHDACDYSLCM